MVNINNKEWEKLRFRDVEKLLAGMDDETIFFEFKSDGTTTEKFVKEVSAFSNTYGGYILLGINDDKTIEGCQNWTEQKIHVAIHDSITPVPNFDVKQFKFQDKKIFVVRVEEGKMPPYITNKGKIFERVSSGSFPVKEASQLAQLYYKSERQLERVKQKIELEKIKLDEKVPNNLCGYLDMGFSVVCREATQLQKNFYTMDFQPIAEHIRNFKNEFSVSRLGHSYLFSIGDMTSIDNNGNKMMLNEGINNFIEIMHDGSVRCRVILTSNGNDFKVDITGIGFMHFVFSEIYKKLMGTEFSKIFVYAQKYERLTVLKQFIPYFGLGTEKEKQKYAEYLLDHERKYGKNLIVSGNRFPKNDYFFIDRKLFDKYRTKYNTKNLVYEFFFSRHCDLGYIDEFPSEEQL